jgi:predicted transcriptional regulator
MDKEQPRKRGRPAKAQGERKDVNFTFRVSPELRSQLQRAAEAAHRSLSSEIEHTLLDYYRQREEFGQVARLVGAAIRMTEEKIGRRWFDDNEAKRMCRIATDLVLNVAFGRPPDKEAELAYIKAYLQMPGLGGEARSAFLEDTRIRLEAESALMQSTLDMIDAARETVISEAREALLGEPPALLAKSKKEPKR